jgi:Capsular polysaccharide synthesis protein
MPIPKKIWAMWLGDMDDTTHFFKRRIEDMHPHPWDVHVITDIRELYHMFETEDEPWLRIMIDNPHIGWAKKSDAIRFFLLKYYGGFWIDLTTFLFCSLDIYYTTDNPTFITMYTQSYMVERIFLNSLNVMSDNVNFQLLKSDKFQQIQSKYIKLKHRYARFPYIPESFFVANVPNHPITDDIFNQLKSFWEKTTTSVVDAQSECKCMNILMNGLAHEVFDINMLEDDLYTLWKDTTPDDQLLENFKHGMLKQMWQCSYIAVYLQMYIALVKHLDTVGVLITQPEERIPLVTPHNEGLCTVDPVSDINFCKPIKATIASSGTVLLIPLSLYRLIKWANTDDERVTFEHTLIYEALKTMTTRDEAQQLFDGYVEKGIFQIKFSHWTRNSPLVKKLVEIFKHTVGGRKKKTRKKKARRRALKPSLRALFR